MSELLYNYDMEASTIGAAMLDNELIPRLAERLSPDDFVAPEYRAIWGAILNMTAAGEPCDIVTISERLESHGQLEDIGGLATLAELARNTPSADNAMAYADIVADYAQRRAGLDVLRNAEQQLRDRGIALDDWLPQTHGQLASVIRPTSNTDLEAIGSALPGVIDRLDRRFNGDEAAMGRTTGLKDLDERLMGLAPGLHVVGARPSMGKTAFMLYLVAADLATPSLVASCEMPETPLIERLFACVGNMPIRAIKDPKALMDEHWPSLTVAVNALKDAPLYIDDSRGQTVAHVRAQAQALHDRHGSIGLIVVDYIQKMRAMGDYGSRYDREIGEIAEGLSDIGKEFGCPVVALAQLNRALEQRPNKRPVMSDLKESSVIEQEAETITFLYRDEVYNPDNPDNKGLAEFISAKVREGETGTTHVYAKLSHGRYENLHHHPSAYAPADSWP